MLRNIAWAALAAVIGGFASFSNAAVAYNSETTIGNDGNFSRAVPGFMQVLTLSTPDVPQMIEKFDLMGVRYNAEVTEGSSAMTVVFYANVDESPSSVDALMNATYLGQATFPLPAGTIGSFLMSDLPINVSIPGNKVGVAVYMTNAAGTDYNFDLAGRMTTGAPSVGSNDGYMYYDQNTDTVFSGSERFREIGLTSQTEVPTNMRVVVSALVPEPTTIALLCPIALMLRRRVRSSR